VLIVIESSTVKFDNRYMAECRMVLQSLVRRTAEIGTENL